MAYALTSSLPQSGNIVSRYILDDAPGNAIDLVGPNTLTAVNTPGSEIPGLTANYDRLRLMDSSLTQYFSIANGSQTGLGIVGGLTIMCWAKLADDTTDHAFVSKYQETGNQRGYLLHNSNGSSDHLQLNISSNGTAVTSLDGTTSLVADTLYNLAGVFEPGTRLELYVNGVTDGNTTTSIPASIFGNSAEFAVGVQSIGSNFEKMNGRMNDVIIWNVALTDAEILTAYNALVTGSIPGPGAASASAYSFFM
jgi:hypothetical protein